MAVHQCTQFCNDPKLSHERAIKRIAQYLLGTKDKGIICRSDSSRGLKCFADADFAGGWERGDSDNPENVMSCTGYVVLYAGCPIIWCSKLQTEIALSTMEAKCIALMQALCKVIPLAKLMQELQLVIPFYNPTPSICCKIFEGNRSCIVIAKSTCLMPRTKHIAIKYQHFREFVKNDKAKIRPIRMTEQVADIFTKPLLDGQFQYLRQKFMMW